MQKEKSGRSRLIFYSLLHTLLYKFTGSSNLPLPVLHVVQNELGTLLRRMLAT